MKTLPRYALVLIALASGVLAVLLFGSILFGLAIALVVPLALTKRVPITKLSAALALGIVAGYLSGYALAAVDGAGKVHFAGSFAVMALFTSLYLLALRKQQSADAGAATGRTVAATPVRARAGHRPSPGVRRLRQRGRHRP